LKIDGSINVNMNSWLNLGERGIYRDLRRKIYSYLNRADRLLVEAAHCGYTIVNDTTLCAGECKMQRYDVAQCQWQEFLAECAKYGYHAPIVWMISRYPEIHSEHIRSSRVIYAAASHNQVPVLDTLSKFFPNMKNMFNITFMTSIIGKESGVAAIKWLREHDADWNWYCYTRALVCGNFELAEYIDDVYRECDCGRPTMLRAGFPAYSDYCIRCDKFVNPPKIHTSHNYWGEVFTSANAVVAEYYWNHGGAKSFNSRDLRSYLRFVMHKRPARSVLIRMLEWVELHGHRINTVEFSVLYMYAAGWTADADKSASLTHGPDFELVRWLHSRGCILKCDHMAMVLFRSLELYNWGQENMAQFDYSSTESNIMNAARYGSVEVCRRMFTGYTGPVSEELLGLVLATRCYELFDEVYARFRGPRRRQAPPAADVTNKSLG
jgi:hypothetical protein